MTTSAQPLKFDTPDHGEESARGDLYGLLAMLFYAPPSQALLDTIARAPVDGYGEGVLQDAWRALAGPCRQTDAEAAREEYEALFIGIGKPELMLYGSYYLSGFMMEKPLAALRADLAQLGLQRQPGVPESEDHIAALCEVMRFLIASDHPLHATIAQQKQFFATHIQAWVGDLCDAIMQNRGARFYGPVAQLAKRFFEVEMQAFDMA
jgi:TorA maturation chaperone TorD